ncbi:MAG: phenylacetate-CoA oxygenase subunit PaaC [Gammaproteobacteria bacterium]|nr:phenylacetate-CoA oxygenase subunit PaaC [Gammaproteobacteria bacterium]
MNKEKALIAYVTRMGDNAIIMAQRLSEWVGHGPELEEEMAMGNFALDYVGQSRMYFSYAGELEGKGRSEDDICFLRDGWDYGNVLLLEQPNGDYGETIARLVLFETFYSLQLGALVTSPAKKLAEIAARAIKESTYHLRHAGHWLIRLGDGTDESHRRVQDAIDRLWTYTGELFEADQVDQIMQSDWEAPDLTDLRGHWHRQIDELLAKATLQKPDDGWMDSGGKNGHHSEHLGYILAEMQSLQRTYPGANW